MLDVIHCLFDRSKPQRTAANRSEPQQTAANRSEPQQTAANRSKPQPKISGGDENYFALFS
jgi:hypothetical protein